MRILLANDDGIKAPGLHALAEALEPLAELYVVAPAREQSGTGHGITVRDPIRVRDYQIAGVKQSWVVAGTPADCVKIALARLVPENIDLVVAGINHGANLGSDVLYSGTVSAAAEGVVMGCPSIAFSLNSHDRHADMGMAAQFAHTLIGQYGAMDIVPGELLNVNFPSLMQSELQGVRFTRLGRRSYGNMFEERLDPMGNRYFWMGGGLLDLEQESDSDVRAVNEGYISITPLSLDLTDFRSLELYRRRSDIEI